MEFTPAFIAQVLQIIWIDLLLSGDNAVVIALACRNLPEKQRKVGIWLGAGAAVGLRIAFAFVVTFLLGVPFLKVVGGLLLFWIAIKLVKGEEEGGHEIAASDTLWRAVRTIAIADAVMSLDNVVAIAAAAKGHPELFIFGLVLSIPLIIVGAQLISSLIERFPLFIWAGAALLGWIAGEMIVSDPVVINWLQANAAWMLKPAPVEVYPSGFGPYDPLHYGAAAVGAAIVVAAGLILRRRAAGAAHHG